MRLPQTIVIHKKENDPLNRLFYTPDKFIEPKNVYGYTFHKEYTMLYVLDCDGYDLKVKVDPCKLNKYFYDVWVEANQDFINSTIIKSLFV